METTVGRVLAVLLSVATAVTAALTAGYTACYDLGFSPEQIRTQAVIIAIVIGLLLAIDHYGKKLRKPKLNHRRLAPIAAPFIDPPPSFHCGPSSRWGNPTGFCAHFEMSVAAV